VMVLLMFCDTASWSTDPRRPFFRLPAGPLGASRRLPPRAAPAPPGPPETGPRGEAGIPALTGRGRCMPGEPGPPAGRGRGPPAEAGTGRSPPAGIGRWVVGDAD